jgi:predicted secreted protein
LTVAGISLEAAFAIFAVVWWLVFLAALPFGVRPDEDPVPGTDPGAPAQPYLLRKALVTTVIAAALTYGLAWVLTSGLIEFRPPPG